MLRETTWLSDTKLGCDCGGTQNVIVCTDHDKAILAQITESEKSGSQYLYTIEYETDDLPEGLSLLGTSNITGVVCDSCFASWVRQYVTEALTEVIAANFEGDDTETIDMTVAGIYPNFVVSGEVLISQDGGNVLESHADGLYVPEAEGEDTALTDVDFQPVDITAFGSLGASLATVLSGIVDAREIEIDNQTDAAIYVSFNGTDDHYRLAPYNSKVFRLGAEKLKFSGDIDLRYDVDAPSVGSVYISYH